MTTKRFFAWLLMLSLLLSCVPATEARSAKKEKGNFAYRIDCLDGSNGNRLAVEVLSDMDGTVHIYKTEAGEAAPTKDTIKRNGYHSTIQAKVESAAYDWGSYNTDKKYNIYILFEDSWGRVYGPYKKANYKPNYFPKGDGTINDPYQIWTERHLRNVSKNMKAGTQYILMQDLDLSGVTDGSVLWGRYSDFNGSLNGNDHTIRGLYGSLVGGLGKEGQIHDLYIANSYTKHEAFFCPGTNYGTIKHCAVCKSEVNSGSLLPAGAIAGINKSVIKRCEVQNVSVSSHDSSGGICGEMRDGKIELCYAEASVAGNTAGGIVGHIFSGKIDGCSANPIRLSVPNKQCYKGGVAGWLSGENAFIAACISLYLPSALEEDIDYDGSIVGYTNGTEYTANCAGNAGSVTWMPQPPLNEGNEQKYEAAMREYDILVEKWVSHHGYTTAVAAEAEIEHPISIRVVNLTANVVAFIGLHIAYTRSYPNETALYNKAYPFINKTIKYTKKSRPGKVKLTSAGLTEGTKIKASWKAVKNASGYEIWTCKGKFAEFEKYKDIKENTYTTYGLYKGYTYGVRVRAYREKNGKKTYGDFSEIKYVTVPE